MTDETNKCRRRQDKMSVRNREIKKCAYRTERHTDRETYIHRDVQTERTVRYTYRERETYSLTDRERQRNVGTN